MPGEMKQVKVDNWGIFFLQRLHHFYSRGELCDLVLQFTNNEKIVVHRLVLNACTDYFYQLERQSKSLIGSVLQLPDHMEADTVTAIINFMYTGRLEYNLSQVNKLYITAKQMNMAVLIKLLDAQAASQAVTKPPPPPPRKQPVTSTQIRRTVPVIPRPVIPRIVDPSLPEPLPGRKLPIWKRRSVPSMPDQNYFGVEANGSKMEEPEDLAPTRFEFPELEGFEPFLNTFDDLSYDTKPILRAQDVENKQRPEYSSFEDMHHSGPSAVKRHLVTTTEDDPASKKLKMEELQAVKEYIQEHKLRTYLLDREEETEDGEDDIAVADLDDDDDNEDDSVETRRGVMGNVAQRMLASSVQKSILKTQSPPPNMSFVSPLQSKRVRFSLDEQSVEEKENSTSKNISNHNVMLHAEEQQPRHQTITVGTSETENLNHAKIISEVLKKYPNLVKKNKNIKLKIMHRNAKYPNLDKNSSKISYVMLKSDTSGKAKGAVTLPVQSLINSANQNKPVSGAENVSGPWLCYTCGTNEDPINFESYYLYRRHLREVHQEKIDARICEHCGHRASKRNLLLYHLYTKHGIQPPRNCQFPKCDKCEYVALSESLLIKHRNNHVNSKDYLCECGSVFKSLGALQGHMQTNMHSEPQQKKLCECPYCQKPFVRHINLKTHIRTAHRDVCRKDEDEEINDSDKTIEECFIGDEASSMQVANIGTEGIVNNMHSTDRSSEAEALSSVASGIAASLGLSDAIHNDQTVIILEDNQEFILQDNVNLGNVSEITYSSDNNENENLRPETQEYIVPEIMSTEECDYQDRSNDDINYQTDESLGTHDPNISNQHDIIPPPSISSSNGVTMILSDHDYAEDSSLTRNDGVMIYIPQSDGTIKIVQHNMALLQNGVITTIPSSADDTNVSSNSKALILSQFMSDGENSNLEIVHRDTITENDNVLQNNVEEIESISHLETADNTQVENGHILPTIDEESQNTSHLEENIDDDDTHIAGDNVTNIPDDVTHIPDDDGTYVPDDEVTHIPDDDVTHISNDDDVNHITDDGVTHITDDDDATHITDDDVTHIPSEALLERESTAHVTENIEQIESDSSAVAQAYEQITHVTDFEEQDVSFDSDRQECVSQISKNSDKDVSVIVKASSSGVQKKTVVEMDDLVREWDFDEDNAEESQESVVTEQTRDVSRYIENDEA